MSSSLDTSLDSIFKNVNEWLKFAEQKNAALVVLNGSSIWGINLILKNSKNLSQCELIFSSVGFLFIVLSALLCLISFTPVFQDPWLSNDKKSKSDNCLYFKHITKYNEFDYLEMLASKLGLQTYSFTKFQLDLASQIIINSKITISKYQKFQISLAMTVTGLIILSFTIFSIYILG